MEPCKIRIGQALIHSGRIFLFLILAHLFWSVFPAQAAESANFKLKLTKVAPVSTTELRGDRAQLNLKLPVPKRWLIRKASLHFSWVNSSALLAERSRLIVSLNGHPLLQIKLEPTSPEGEADVDLPAALLLPGYNDLDFIAVQNYTEECSDPNAPELWTTLKLDESHIEIEYDHAPVPETLVSLTDFLFDPKILDETEIHLVLENDSETILHLAALTASGVALRFQYKPAKFTVSKQLKPGCDNIAIGGREFVRGILGERMELVGDGNLAVLRIPDEEMGIDSARGLVVVTGDTPQDLLLAAQSLSILSFPWPDTPSTLIKDVQIPEITKYSGKLLLSPGKDYLFSELGFTSASRNGLRPAGISLPFRLPADFYIKTNEFVTLSLHLAFGAAMREDSVLNCYLNNRLAGVIPLNDSKGGRYRGYRLDIPNNLLKPGVNFLSLNPVLTPSKTGQCQYIQTENLAITVFDDSVISLPDMAHWTEMPEVALFFEDGFPMTKWPDWRDASVVLLDKSEETLSAAMNIVALISQKTGVAPYGLRFAFDLAQGQTSDMLVVGPFDAAPESLLKASPVAPDIPYPFVSSIKGKENKRNWWTRIKENQFISAFFPPKPPELSPKPANVKITTPMLLGEKSLFLAAFESPWSTAKTVMLVTAKSPRDLLAGTAGLWEPSVQSQCRDNLVLIDFKQPKPTAFTLKAGERYFVGQIGKVRVLDHFLYTYPWIALGLMIVCLIIIALILRSLLRRVRKKRDGDLDK
jgi:hypothetical protein